MFKIYISNALITILVGTLLFIFKDLSNPVYVANIVCLLVTLEIPTLYLLSVHRLLKRDDRETIMPSLFFMIFVMVVDIVFYSISIACYSTDLKLLILYTSIFHVIVAAILLIINAITSYIRKQH